jgi:hypothetical protein
MITKRLSIMQWKMEEGGSDDIRALAKCPSSAWDGHARHLPFFHKFTPEFTREYSTPAKVTSQSRTARSLTFLLKISHNVAKVGKGNTGSAVFKTFLIKNVLRKNKIDMPGGTDIGMPVADIDDL